ncbi:o-succinylbenzoate synthase [Rhodospira trueperi]|uniref:o-succinylbenzoate synthase n=1 Tax=Rhodospira trueperi TaxID=69960 RepID=A0A1G7GM51_9PROT|nr:o-succinylbenzoate synthase [Rhodospira trueperi]SDE89268.1 O-succinylbenzoate synthase [Rhodospira trueperi]
MYASIRIDGATLELLKLPLAGPFTVSTGTTHEKIVPLLTLRSGGLEGYAEGVADPHPEFLDETISGSVALLRETLLPGIIGKSFENPSALERVMAVWRGHQMTKAMIEMAFWDLWAKSLGMPLKTALGGTGDRVDVGVSLGIEAIPETVEKALEHDALGYKRIKLKIRPNHDLDLVAAVRVVLPHAHISVDANTAYSLSDLPLLQKLDDFDLDYIEQPLGYDDLHDHAVLQSVLMTPVCLDESIRSSVQARKALQTGATRVINVKVGRVGGYQEARRIHDLTAAWGFPVWCGGMLESGVGRAHNIHLATLPNFCRPGDTSSSSRYFAKDIIQEPLEAVDGQMPVPPGPGIGVTLDQPFIRTVSTYSETFC